MVEFYKNLFGPVGPRSIQLAQGFWGDDRKVKDGHMEGLIKAFPEEEVKQVVFEMRQDAAPGPNGFGATFQNFWEVIKNKYLEMFLDFHNEVLDIRRLNYGVITLVPKTPEANTIKQYRPICLLNVDYKIFTKVLTERLTPVAKEVIGEN